MDFDVHEIHAAAIEIARMGGSHTLRWFRKEIDVERKQDDSPVTIADREAETVMREEIIRRFPDHGVLGEEHGAHNPEASVQWILDPIDGTKSFIHGVAMYTTLVGVLVNNEPIAGVIYAPALDELCEAAKGKGARLNGETCRVRACKSLADATLLSTDVTSHSAFGFGDAFETLLQSAWLHRTWGDAYGHMMVATGRADVMFDPELSLWDAAPLQTILQEAGGSFTDVHGRATIQTGNGISCSKGLLPEVLKAFE